MTNKYILTTLKKTQTLTFYKEKYRLYTSKVFSINIIMLYSLSQCFEYRYIPTLNGSPNK